MLRSDDMPTKLSFATSVAVSPDDAWRWITSLAGISREMAPYLRMTAPRGVSDLSSMEVRAGRPLFRSWILLFGVLPIDYSDLTLLSLEPGVGLVEQSPMGSMRSWRHERRIVPEGRGCRICDALTFEPRFARTIVVRIVRAFFRHRHRMLARHLGGTATRP